MTRRVLLFYLALFLLTSSGRLSSADAGAELQASMLLATTGRLGALAPPQLDPAGWPRLGNGRYYEPHDIGAPVLLIPAALAGHLTSRRPAQADFDAPPLLSRVAASLTYAGASAIGCTFFFALLAVDRGDARRAFLLSLLLPLTTMFWPYAKTAWDVVGGACGMCAVLYCGRRALDPGARPGTFAALGATAAVTCSFRYSLLPFVVLSLIVLAAARRDRWREWLLAAGVLLAGMTPSFVYNDARTGSWLRPATASDEYLASNNALTGSLWHGLAGLLTSPNRGIVVFAPLCVLIVGLPFVWRRLRPQERRLIVAMGIGAVSYLLLIAKLRNWGGTFGWGPRFLLPVLPIAMYASLVAMDASWARYRRAFTAVIVAAAVWQAPAILVNWSAAIAVSPRALDQDAPGPYQHIAVWRMLIGAIEGRPVALPPALEADPERRAGADVPDLWIARLVERM